MMVKRPIGGSSGTEAAVSMAAAVVLAAVAQVQCWPLVRSAEDGGSLWTHSIFWQYLAIIWHPFWRLCICWYPKDQK
jgi:hypothetical protein